MCLLLNISIQCLRGSSMWRKTTALCFSMFLWPVIYFHIFSLLCLVSFPLVFYCLKIILPCRPICPDLTRSCSKPFEQCLNSWKSVRFMLLESVAQRAWVRYCLWITCFMGPRRIIHNRLCSYTEYFMKAFFLFGLLEGTSVFLTARENNSSLSDTLDHRQPQRAESSVTSMQTRTKRV